jgi:hypothetical protein
VHVSNAAAQSLPSAVRPAVIAKRTGQFGLVLGGLAAAPLLVSLAAGEAEAALQYAVVLVTLAVLGTVLARRARLDPDERRRNTAWLNPTKNGTPRGVPLNVRDTDGPGLARSCHGPQRTTAWHRCQAVVLTDIPHMLQRNNSQLPRAAG